mgnify:CR=1 FL=1
MILEGVSGTVALIAGGAVVLLLASSIWAHYRFADYDRLPRQFGLDLKPTSYGPSWLVIWMVPVIMMAALALVLFLPSVVASRSLNGDPETGAVIASIVTVGAQAFILWLLTRWARSQA